MHVLNVVDGCIPADVAQGEHELEEERRLLYVAMTRARNELCLLQPLKFPLTQQAPRGDAHVYGGRSRFVTDKVLKCFEQSGFTGSHVNDSTLLQADEPLVIDATGRLKDMW